MKTWTKNLLYNRMFILLIQQTQHRLCKYLYTYTDWLQLTGDLAEAVLIQGTERGSSSISVGTAGNWNSTQAPRYFMIHSRINTEMTDPEIRGDIDGFVLGNYISNFLSTFSSLKLSTLLDMYYSPRVSLWLTRPTHPLSVKVPNFIITIVYNNFRMGSSVKILEPATAEL